LGAINARDKQGKDALWYACKGGKSSEVVNLLLQAGADPMVRSEEGENAMEVVRKMGHEECLEVLQVGRGAF